MTVEFGCFLALLVIKYCAMDISGKLSDITEVLKDIRDLLKGGAD